MRSRRPASRQRARRATPSWSVRAVLPVASRMHWRRVRLPPVPPGAARLPLRVPAATTSPTRSSRRSGGTDTGNLRARDGRQFGFELTFFRQATSSAVGGSRARVAVGRARRLSRALRRCRTSMARRFHHEERVNRAGPASPAPTPHRGRSGTATGARASSATGTTSKRSRRVSRSALALRFAEAAGHPGRQRREPEGGGRRARPRTTSR